MDTVNKGNSRSKVEFYAVVVSPGQISTAELETAPCNGALEPGCDDLIDNLTDALGNVIRQVIVAGPNGFAETFAEKTEFGLTINSGWRNPERNRIPPAPSVDR